MKWPITDPTQAVILIGALLFVFTLLQVLTAILMGGRSSDKLQAQLENAKLGFAVGLPVAGIVFLTMDGGRYLFLFALYLLSSWWFACHLALRFASRK